ncbi:MerR family transcriptional regulator [Streptomyces sp. MJP52]|uniref:MerR family transcriptional regulator n=1 Tax=Streptomyces sp. MJP52 TaxID=2940555 RepID=UPI00247305D7|nr:MerR family transcriptional regulator [Streptomyces sp. MJP52]MDH6226462.1 DNA-binding transcriptional MerR regulator [Streptomyces sp. MJP52]
MSDELISIGAFAARVRLSAKALRLYDRLGLLTPAYVDPATGYRYYRHEQVERARTIVHLRHLDMPLAAVADVVALMGHDGRAAAERVGAYWADVEARLAGQRALVDFLRARLDGRSSLMSERYTTETVDVPGCTVLTLQRHVLAGELPAWIGATLDRLTTVAAEECGGVAAAPFVVYHSEVSQESDGPAEVCVPVREAGAAREWAARHGKGMGVRGEPARRLAFTRITKAEVAQPMIMNAFEAVERWVADRGLRIAAPCREVYFADWPSAEPTDPVCDVAYPVEVPEEVPDRAPDGPRAGSSTSSG